MSTPDISGEPAHLVHCGQWDNSDRLPPCIWLEMKRCVRVVEFYFCFGLMQLVGILAILAVVFTEWPKDTTQLWVFSSLFVILFVLMPIRVCQDFSRDLMGPHIEL